MISHDLEHSEYPPHRIFLIFRRCTRLYTKLQNLQMYEFSIPEKFRMEIFLVSSRIDGKKELKKKKKFKENSKQV